MILGAIVESLGFKDEAEFHFMVAKIDCSTPRKMAAFKNWQHNDGTKEGLQKLAKLPSITFQTKRSVREVATIMGVLGQIGLPPLDLETNNTKEKRTMPIVVKTEKCFFGGKPMYKILKIEALPQEKLPINYLRGTPRCFSTSSGKLMIYSKPNPHSKIFTEIVPGIHYTENELKAILSNMYACGERLQQIHKISPKKWEGKESFII